MNKVSLEGSIVWDSKSSNFDWDQVTQTIKTLTDQNYEVIFRYEDSGVYVLEYCYDPRSTDYGADRFMLVSADEEENILLKRDHPCRCCNTAYKNYIDEENMHKDAICSCDFDFKPYYASEAAAVKPSDFE